MSKILCGKNIIIIQRPTYVPLLDTGLLLQKKKKESGLQFPWIGPFTQQLITLLMCAGFIAMSSFTEKFMEILN